MNLAARLRQHPRLSFATAALLVLLLLAAMLFTMAFKFDMISS